ncbi:MAG: T9SS type A sorting domain-containing protein [Flaviramulus sp.]|nr:T9SS type A sorting domain-containing protein [Flaviramulus sp.]NNC49057.1 T9SS type A sorting domain-containing protein [Flaviramulus sp.]
MKKHYLFVAILFFITKNAVAQTIWTGPTTTFTKANFADWTLEANQDRLTSNVWITRANTKGIFNIVVESVYDDTNFFSPLDTEWSFGTTSDIGTLTFTYWEDAVAGNPPGMVNQDMVVHLITDDIYIDIKFTSWSQGGASGGGFSYDRSTDQALDINDFEKQLKIKLFPNPASDYIQISGLDKGEMYSIYNVLGTKVDAGFISNYEKIDVQNIAKGLYFLKLESGNTIKFSRE